MKTEEDNLMMFSLTSGQVKKIHVWLHQEVYPKIIQKQKENTKIVSSFISDCWDAGYPYEGASGGGLTYEFTPTSLGINETVRYGEYSLDLTDYDSW